MSGSVLESRNNLFLELKNVLDYLTSKIFAIPPAKIHCRKSKNPAAAN